MCVFWHPRITPWHHFTNKTALKKLNEESGPNCFIDSTVKIFYCFGVYLFFSSIGKLWVELLGSQTKKKQKNLSWQEKVVLWLWPNDQIRERKRCICPAFDPNESLLFSEATGKRATFWHSCRGEGEAEVSGVPLHSFTAEEDAF